MDNQVLTSDELAKFINDIENDDSNYTESMEESIKRIQEEELRNGDLSPEEMMDDKAWGINYKSQETENEDGETVRRFEPVTILYTDLAEKGRNNLKNYHERKVRERAEKLEAIRERKLEIQQEALKSTFISLDDTLTTQFKKLLIELLTKEYSDSMDKTMKYITTRVEKLLKPYIPSVVKNCYYTNKDTMIEHPGFMYTASTEYGENKMLWIKPDIPYYFKQFTEMNVLVEYCSRFLYNIDKAVVNYYAQKETLDKMSLKYAVKLRNVRNFYDLVKLNPFWYDTLAQELVKLINAPSLKEKNIITVENKNIITSF